MKEFIVLENGIPVTENPHDPEPILYSGEEACNMVKNNLNFGKIYKKVAMEDISYGAKYIILENGLPYRENLDNPEPDYLTTEEVESILPTLNNAIVYEEIYVNFLD